MVNFRILTRGQDIEFDKTDQQKITTH